MYSDRDDTPEENPAIRATQRTMLMPFIVFLVLLEVGLPLLLLLGQNRMIFFPSARPSPEEGLRWVADRGQIRLVRFPRADGRLLSAYDARPPDGAAAREAPVILFFHGNAGNLAQRAPLLEDFVIGTGVRTVMIDYSGYGGNDGSPSEQEVYRDGLSAFDFLDGEGVAPSRIVLYGESLGAAVAIEVASRRPCAGVIAQSPFASLSSMALRLYPWLPLTALLARGSFASIDKVRGLPVPLLVVHGTRDEIIPFAEGEKLHQAGAEHAELLPIPNAGHNDLFEVAGKEYLRLVGERARSWTSAASSEPGS